MTIAERIVMANADLQQRLEKLDLRVSYDEEFDIFLLAIGDPQEAITEEIDDAHGLQLRVDPDTLKIAGFEIMEFRKRYLAAHPEFRVHFQALFDKGKRREAQEAATHICAHLNSGKQARLDEEGDLIAK